MKLLVLSIATFFAISSNTGDFKTISIGADMPAMDTELIACDGSKTNLENLLGSAGTLVIFSCNTCPFVVGSKDSDGWENRYNKITEIAESNGVSTVLVNSNEAKRDNGDDLNAMKARKVEQGYKSAYVLDRNSAVADAFGARTTPHVFLFDSKNKLVYTGAIDDNVASAKDVKETWLEDALQAIGQGTVIDPATTRNTGCSIKRAK